MNKRIGIFALMFAVVPFVQAQDNSTDTRTTTTTTTSTNTPDTVGDGVRQAGRDVKRASKKARRAVITKCADGRHTIKGKAECSEGHGGVSPAN